MIKLRVMVRIMASTMGIILLLAMGTAVVCGSDAESVNPYAVWEGFVPDDDPYFFPIGVCTQDPKNAGKYKILGFNVYNRLWQGPDAKKIEQLKKHNMRVICEMNDYAKEHLLKDPIVLGWTQGDEPDLAKFSKRKLMKMSEVERKKLVKDMWPKMYAEKDMDNKPYKGWGFGYSPEYCAEHYQEIKKIDPTRPVILGLSNQIIVKGPDRGDRTNHNEDYPPYINNCSDLMGYDHYPVAYGTPEKLWEVAEGLKNLKKWSNDDRKHLPLRMTIECTFGRPDKGSANIYQIRFQIWSSIINNARAIMYFVHNFNKKGAYVTDSGLLKDPEMMQQVTKQNAEIKELAKVIYAADYSAVTMTSKDTAIEFMSRKVDGKIYIIAVNMKNETVMADFSMKDTNKATAVVHNEGRSVAIENGSLSEEFAAFDTNIYVIDVR